MAARFTSHAFQPGVHELIELRSRGLRKAACTPIPALFTRNRAVRVQRCATPMTGANSISAFVRLASSVPEHIAQRGRLKQPLRPAFQLPGRCLRDALDHVPG
jgi:hypothetical protein